MPRVGGTSGPNTRHSPVLISVCAEAAYHARPQLTGGRGGELPKYLTFWVCSKNNNNPGKISSNFRKPALQVLSLLGYWNECSRMLRISLEWLLLDALLRVPLTILPMPVLLTSFSFRAPVSVADPPAVTVRGLPSPSPGSHPSAAVPALSVSTPPPCREIVASRCSQDESCMNCILGS